MSFLTLYRDRVELIIQRKQLLIHDNVFSSDRCYEELIVKINQQNNNIFGDNLTVDNVIPIMVTSDASLTSWTDDLFLFGNGNVFYVIQALDIDRRDVFLYPHDSAIHIVKYGYLVYKFISTFKFFHGCYPFEILHPETSRRPLIFIPFIPDEYADDVPF